MNRSTTVLIVDDDVFLNEPLALLVGMTGAEILQAYDGRQALEIVMHNEIDAVISDVNMPGMNGLELLREIKQCNQELPVIIISGAVNAELADEAFASGAISVLAKPFSDVKLMHILQKAIGLKRAGRAPSRTWG